MWVRWILLLFIDQGRSFGWAFVDGVYVTFVDRRCSWLHGFGKYRVSEFVDNVICCAGSRLVTDLNWF